MKKQKISRKKEQHKISKREKCFEEKKREKRDEENVVLIHVKINHKTTTTTEVIKRQRKSSLSIEQSGLDRSHEDVASTMQLVIQGAHLQHSEARIK